MTTTMNLINSVAVDTFDCLPQGIIILDSGFRVVYWNLTLEEWTGIPRAEIVGQDITKRYPHLAAPRYIGRIQPLFDGGPPVIFSSQLHHYFVPALLPSGHFRIQHTTVSSMVVSSHSYALVSMQDVSDLTFLAQKSRHLHAKAIDELEMKIQIEEALRIDEARLESLLKIAQLDPMPTPDLLEHVLNEAVRITQSKFGFIFRCHKENDELEPLCWTRNAFEASELVEYLYGSEMHASGVFYDLIKLCKPLIVNDIQASHAAREGHSEKKLNLTSILCAPVLFNNDLVALAAVVNKEKPYDASDIRQLKLLMDAGWKIKMQRTAELQLNNAYALVESLLNNSPVGVRVFDAVSGQCILANAAAGSIAGGPVHALKEQNFRELDSWKNSGLLDVAERVIASGEPYCLDTVLHTAFGKVVPVKYQLTRFVVNGCMNLLVMGQDISEEIRLSKEKQQIEEQWLHAQKMESLGILAGGVAHDFNNILMSILGNTELALLNLPEDSETSDYLARIRLSTKRASELANQMLTYSGKGTFAISPLNVNNLVTEITHLLEVSISKKTTLDLQLHTDSLFVDGDETQLRQVIMNLVINGAEAIDKNKGVITVSTGHVVLTSEELRDTMFPDNLCEGPAVFIRVTDSGCGMDKDTMLKMFDPFFTTKFTGRGLGMAAVLGIIRSHKGTIKVHSHLGLGTTFTVLLPLSQKQKIATEETGPAINRSGNGLVLLVDDEEHVREIGKGFLNFLGYQCITAESGQLATEIYAQNPDINYVILDLTMPDIDGLQVYDKLKEIRADVKVILSSGYSEYEVSCHLQEKKFSGFLKKPYTISALNAIMTSF